MDKQLQHRLRCAALAALLCLLAGALAFFRLRETAGVDQLFAQLDSAAQAVVFSAESGFYSESLTVTVRPASGLPRSVSLHYTLDGSDPTPDSPECGAGGVRLTARPDQLTVYPLKVAVCYKGECRVAAQRSYVVGADSGFTLPVVSLACDQEALYDPDSGIFANYSARGDEWIRPAQLTLFGADGSVLLERGVGLGVSGGTSAAFPVRSLRIEGGSDYDARYDGLQLDLLAADSAPSPVSRIGEYNHLRLRSGSQDLYEGCNIRSSLLSRLAEQSGFDGYSGTQRCVVYLNGEFYGIMDLQQPCSASYLADRFSLPDTGAVQTLKGTELFLELDEADRLDQLFRADLNDPANRAALEAQVDMDNFLLYYAIEILANNTDWPGNNFEMWRYLGPPVAGNPYTDGRWRFFLYDADLIYFGHMDAQYDQGFFEGCRGDTFTALMEGLARGEGSVFPSVMASEEYRGQFLALVSDLLNTSFRTENVLALARQEYRLIRAETARQQDAAWMARMDEAYRNLLLAIREREELLRAALADHLGAEEQYTVTVAAGEGASIRWSSQQLSGGETYQNEYYCGAPFRMTAEPEPGYTFAYWWVNGHLFYDPELTVSDALASRGALTVRAVCRRAETGVALIQEVSAQGLDDWIKIFNAGTQPLRLGGCYLSDDGDDLLKYRLPDVTLDPGESVCINGKKNLRAVGDYLCSFNLKSAETLFLSDSSGVCLDRVAVPQMESWETYGRLLPGGQWVFFDNRDGARR